LNDALVAARHENTNHTDMADTPTPRRGVAVLALCALLACAAAGAQESQPAEQQPQQAQPQQPQRPAPKRDRVYLTDLEGTWISRDYLERLRASRAPHATGRQAAGIAIKIQREGNSYPIAITNFQRVVLQAIIDVQPEAKPKEYRLAVAQEDRPGISASELTYIPFRGERNADGVFRTLLIAEPTFAKRRFLTYLRLTEPLETLVNRMVIAGQYVDADGNYYEFTESGEAMLPDAAFAYEVSLDPGNANCELLISHREREPEGTQRIGFAWKRAELLLYRVSGKKAPFKCASKPFAVLKRQ
jgi:hypothetical protein